MKRIVNQDLIDLIVKEKAIENPIEGFEKRLSATYVNTQLTEVDVRLSGWIKRQKPSPIELNSFPIHVAFPDNWTNIWDKEIQVDDRNAIYIAPGEMILGKTIETFNLPEDVMAEFSLRSWSAKSGLNQSTSLSMKPNWEGQLVLELHNCLKDRGLCFYPGAEIGQVSFYRTEKRNILEWLLGKK